MEEMNELAKRVMSCKISDPCWVLALRGCFVLEIVPYPMLFPTEMHVPVGRQLLLSLTHQSVQSGLDIW